MLGTTSLRAADLLVPAAITLLGVVELALTNPPGWGYGVALESAAGILLVWRRIHPVVVCTVAAVVLLWMPWVGPQLDDVATPILTLALVCYSLGRWVESLRGLVGIGLLLAMFLADYLLVDLRSHDVTDIVFVCALAIPPYVFGRISRKLAVQSELLEHNQDLLRRQAVREERDRIARELHDVIAHSVSAMVVQTAAAQDLVRTDPDRAESVLADVAATGRRALTETGRLLHIIRDEPDELGLAPAPGLAQLPELVDQFRTNGLRVDLVAESLPELPPGVDVSAYRIVQEALTNALKYASDPTVELRIGTGPDGLTIKATNPSNGRSGSGSGLGLAGMAERVDLLGGTLRHGPRDGSFELEARLPVRTS